ncbi:hypothetical protein [Comamonas sp. JC664]|uniref:hypothetical protein n=1 Tax=Comamonas sp. JC664 TaxID=2801917 RepID=UPI00188C2982|nr:hypothetical protein [Comamonas sp. JC664]
MTKLMRVLRRSALVGVVLGLSACGGVEMPEGTAPETDALVSSEGRLTCSSCGPTQHTETMGGQGIACGAAYRDATEALQFHMQQVCPGGACNIRTSLVSCRPMGPNRDDGFEAEARATFHCCL